MAPCTGPPFTMWYRELIAGDIKDSGFPAGGLHRSDWHWRQHHGLTLILLLPTSRQLLLLLAHAQLHGRSGLLLLLLLLLLTGLLLEAPSQLLHFCLQPSGLLLRFLHCRRARSWRV